MLVGGPPRLYAPTAEPLKIHEQFEPINAVKLRDSVYVFDLGQNASGIPQINVIGKKGSTVRIIPAELLKEDGSANQRATGSPVYFEYVLKGGETETWQPRFSYYGFRYLQVEGVSLEGDSNLAELPLRLGVRGLHTGNAADQVGFFHCSSELFNKTHALIDWSIKSNLASVMTDCPHREKLGWLEQVHLMGNSIRFNYDMAGFFRKTIRDMKTAQGNGKLVPEYVPEYVKMPFMDGIFMDSPEWGSTSIILPWYLYQWYGDRRTLEESYPMMQKYLEHLKEKSKDHIVAYGLSDWYDLGPERPGLAQLTPMGVTGTAIYYYDLGIMSKTAKLLGKTADARKYDELAIEVRKAFNHKFFDPQTKQYATGSQTANAIAVYTGLVEPQNRQAVIENIIKDLRSRNNALTAGDIGYRYLLRVLEEAGRSDVIFDMNSRSDVPGYGYQLKKGATALTESWMASPLVSNNHLMLGHLMEWFYTGLAGLGQEEGSTGFKNMVIRPQPVGDLTGLSVMFNAPYGWVNTKWESTDQRFELNITIPPNTTATVRIPAANANWISEGKKKLKEHSELKMVRTGEGWVDVKIGSGNYHFIVEELKSN